MGIGDTMSVRIVDVIDLGCCCGDMCTEFYCENYAPREYLGRFALMNITDIANDCNRVNNYKAIVFDRKPGTPEEWENVRKLVEEYVDRLYNELGLDREVDNIVACVEEKIGRRLDGESRRRLRNCLARYKRRPEGERIDLAACVVREGLDFGADFVYDCLEECLDRRDCKFLVISYTLEPLSDPEKYEWAVS